MNKQLNGQQLTIRLSRYCGGQPAEEVIAAALNLISTTIQQPACPAEFRSSVASFLRKYADQIDGLQSSIEQ